MEHLWTPWRMAYILTDKQAGCVFCDMLESSDDRGNLILHRGEFAFIVMNKYPYNNGHLMTVPYRHVDSIEGLSEPELTELMALTKQGMAALRTCMCPGGFNLGANIGAVAGAGVKGHVHLHVVPRWGGDTNFMPVIGEVRVIPQDLTEAYDQIRASLDLIKP